MTYRNLRLYLFATLLPLFSVGAWGIPILEANPDNTAPNVGDTVNVALDLTGNSTPGLVIMDFDFYYDTTKLNLVSATAGDFFSANPGSSWVDFSSGTSGLSVGDSVDTLITDPTTTPDVLGFKFLESNFMPSVNDGTLVNLQFTALATGSAGLSFNDVFLIEKALGNNFPKSYSNTDVTDVVVATVSVPEPTTLPLIALGMLFLIHRRLKASIRPFLPFLQPQRPSRFG